MGRGGSREGAGRPRLTGTVSVHWRIMPMDKDWIDRMIRDTGANTFEIIHQLVESFKGSAEFNNSDDE